MTQAPGVDGYVVANNTYTYIQDPESGLDWTGMCLGSARDVDDLFVVGSPDDPQEWMLWGSNLYRPLWSEPELGVPRDWVVNGEDGLGEWRKVPPADHGAQFWQIIDQFGAECFC